MYRARVVAGDGFRLVGHDGLWAGRASVDTRFEWLGPDIGEFKTRDCLRRRAAGVSFNAQSKSWREDA
jgi:hypothetical protein